MSEPQERKTIEARCYECGVVWDKHNCHDPARVGREHAANTGHYVRVSINITELHNENRQKRPEEQ